MGHIPRRYARIGRGVDSVISSLFPHFIKILATACVSGPVLSPKIQSLLFRKGQQWLI